MSRARNWLQEERRKTLGDWVAFCLRCGFVQRYFEEFVDELHMPVQSVLDGTDGIPAVVIGVLAHEYGHHVQDMSGILLAESRREKTAGRDTEAGLELSRRLELQANCFAGMFLASVAGRGSITKSMAATGAAAFADGGGEKDHGTAPNQGRWAQIGYQQNKTAACNTWAAPQGDVS